MKNTLRAKTFKMLLAGLTVGSTIVPNALIVGAEEGDSVEPNPIVETIQLTEDVLLKIKALDESVYQELMNLTDDDIAELNAFIGLPNAELDALVEQGQVSSEIVHQVKLLKDYITNEYVIQEETTEEEVNETTDEEVNEIIEEEETTDEEVNEIIEEETTDEEVNEIIEEETTDEEVNEMIEEENMTIESEPTVTAFRNAMPTQSIPDLSQLSRAGFIQEISKYAKQVAVANNLHASVIVAQAALETGYGKSGLSKAPNYNIFGIKGAYNGQSVAMRTWEDDGKGNAYYITTNFKKYPSYLESLQDYAHLIRNGVSWNRNIYSGTWRNNAPHYSDATKALTGVYATDTRYNVKLDAIIREFKLYELDNEGLSKPVTPSTGNKSIHEIANEVIAKKWDNGSKRRELLQKAGYDPDAVQTEVNRILSGASSKPEEKPVLKSIHEIAKEVIAKKWDNGSKRRELLQKAGYDPDAVQTEVNRILNGSSTTTPTPKPENKPSTSMTTHTVRSGESLSVIARRYGTTVNSLVRLNNIRNANIIRVGQKLTVASSTDKPETVKPVRPTIRRHRVDRGDTLWAIAKKYNISISKIKKDNNLRSSLIFVGQQLIIK